MIVYDPDVVRWGLHTLIDTCCIPNSGSPNGAVTWYESSPVGYVSEGYCVNSVENDAVIARALQEEYSRIAAAEASGVQNPGQDTILAQDWAQKVRDSESCSERRLDAESCATNREDDCGKAKNEAVDDMSVSAAEKQSYDIEGIIEILETADESARDGEVGKRLNQMVPVPHIPKINGEIPSEDEEISDHQRLLERLKVYELIENKVQGDGNCQFRAISDQLYRSPEYHKFVREQVIHQLKSYPEIYGGCVPMAYYDYLKKMSKSGEWGDHVTLQAAADSYGIKIFVITSFKDTCYIEILPQEKRSNRVIFLSFWAEVHYNSIYPEGELPLPETKERKKWWSMLIG